MPAIMTSAARTVPSAHGSVLQPIAQPATKAAVPARPARKQQHSQGSSSALPISRHTAKSAAAAAARLAKSQQAPRRPSLDAPSLPRARSTRKSSAAARAIAAKQIILQQEKLQEQQSWRVAVAADKKADARSAPRPQKSVRWNADQFAQIFFIPSCVDGGCYEDFLLSSQDHREAQRSYMRARLQVCGA